MAQVLYLKDTQDRKYMSDIETTENYTKVPNAVLDCLMAKIKSMSELKVIFAIVRQTNGYQKKTDVISITQFEKLTGLTRQGVVDGIALGLKHGYITREAAGQSWNYTLQLVNRLDYLNEGGSQQIRPEVVNEIDQQLVNRLDTQKKGLNKTLKKLTTPKGVAAPPQKSRTIDLSDYPAKEPQPEEQPLTNALLPDTLEATTQPGPATNKGRAGARQDSKHIPSSPQLDLGQEVKGFEAEGGKRDMHANSKGKARDERLDNPAIILYRQNCKLTPNEVQRDMIITQVTDLGEWEKNLKYWMGAGYKPGSVDKIVALLQEQELRERRPHVWTGRKWQTRLWNG
jgi:phage replication O-like protein O